MLNKTDNSAKINSASVSARDITSVSAETALQMRSDGKVKAESIQVSDKGIVSFEDLSGNLFRSELNSEQLKLFRPDKTEQITSPENKVAGDLQLSGNLAAGSAKTFTSLFADHPEQPAPPELKVKTAEKGNSDDQWKINA